MTTDREHMLAALRDACSALSRVENHWESLSREDKAAESCLTEHYAFGEDLFEVVTKCQVMRDEFLKFCEQAPKHGSPGSHVNFICNGRVLSGVVAAMDPHNTAYRTVAADGAAYRVHNCDLRPSQETKS